MYNKVFPWYRIQVSVYLVSSAVATIIQFFCNGRSALIQFFLFFPTCAVMIIASNNRENDVQEKLDLLEKEWRMIANMGNLMFCVNTLAFTSFDENWSFLFLLNAIIWYAT
jgi:hypothetical protein